MAVLPGLGPVLAVCCSLVGLVVDLSAECMCELFCGTAAFLTQIVALSEVLAQVLIITVDSKVKNNKKIYILLYNKKSKTFLKQITKKR